MGCRRWEQPLGGGHHLHDSQHSQQDYKEKQQIEIINMYVRVHKQLS